MSIERSVSLSTPTLSPADTIGKALQMMDEHKMAALPIVSDEEYIALVTEDHLLEAADDSVALDDPGMLQFRPAISSLSHPFDALRIMYEAKLSVLPVINTENKYMGSITKDTLIDHFATQTGISSPGGILVLEVSPRNYSMYEIARICENEDVAILGMQLHTGQEGMLEVTLKLNRTVLDAVVASFSRHNYHVTEVYGRESDKEDMLEKYNLLMNYINM
ncbi:hypothetical protein GCM10023093_21260 [Nemorincola caseinilytica]|uniref:CBS domain-containing protein n=1 Tax=Nemorincola caseinilytica TaxID=2054315 RepID=A0ABP8NK06_9BACT